MNQNHIIQKLWNLCNVLLSDGIHYADYVTELAQLIFIKMVHEQSRTGIIAHPLPDGCCWTDLTTRSGIDLFNHYKRILLALSSGKDGDGNIIHEDALISAIYADAQTRLREPRHLEQIIKTLDSLDWFTEDKDDLGDLYEGLLEKNANESKSGAGQYFTPRALIHSMVRCIRPQAGETIQDPAAGTAGFLIAADQYIKAHTDDHFDLTQAQADFQKHKAFIGVELVPNTRRLALMNCLLHNISGEQDGAVHLGNSLGDVGKGLPAADIILANPPFGTAKGGEASITRDDLTYATGNKQLAFLQHIYRNLKPGGRAAIVLPDNVLFESGVGTDIRRDLMDKCNLHTILRLPTGIFYAQGVKTNVLFFSKGSATDPRQSEGCTENVWVYDLRTNMPSFGKRTPFTEAHLKPFEAVYGEDPHGQSPREEGEWSFAAEQLEADPDADNANQGIDDRLAQSRWRCFSREWIREQKGDSLDISWLKDKDSIDAANLPEPAILAAEAKAELDSALAELDTLLEALGDA